MAITNAQKEILNKMCISAQSVSLGTELQATQATVEGTETGTHVVTGAEATAETLDIVTGITAISGFIVQVYRAGILLGSYDVTATAGTLTIANNSTTYVLTENDVINYFVF